MSRMLILATAILVLLATAGCSRAGPSDSEIEAALKTRIAKQTADMGPGAMQVESVRKIRCAATGAPDAFDCDVEVVMGGAMAGKGNSHLSLVKDNGAWTVVGVFSIH